MKDHKKEFIAFAIDAGAIQFEDIELKSGRISPYFFNTGAFSDGRSAHILAEAYAQTLIDHGVEFDGLFGPAYKGIPLAVSIADALYAHHDKTIAYTFDRKEKKDHGEGGWLVGAPLSGRIVIPDDVTTDGATKREAVDMIKGEGATPVGIVLAFDRKERRQDTELSAVTQLEEDLGIPVMAIASVEDLITYLEQENMRADDLVKIKQYREQYGT